MITASLLLSVSVSLSAPAPAQVHVVDIFGGPGSQHTQIYQAVAAAAPGDTILVRNGTYIGFDLVAKGVVVTADLGATVLIDGRIVVRDLPAGQSVRISGLMGQTGTFGEGLLVRDCDGPVWIEDCFFAGPALPATAPTHAAQVVDSAAVSFHRCKLEGARSLDVPGGDGLRSSDSLVALYDCTLIGGMGGGTVFGSALPPGEGAHVSGGTLYASGSSLEGGQGGSGSSPFGCADAGDGAPGLRLEGTAPLAHLLDTTTIGGEAGTAQPPCVDGVPGPGQLVASGTVLEQPHPARSTQAPNPVRPGETLTVTLEGEPGDIAFLWVSALQAPNYVPPGGDPVLPLFGGVFLPDVATSVIFTPGALPPGGLQLPFAVPNPSGGVWNLYAQALLVSVTVQGGLVFSSAQGITVLGAGL